MILFLDETGLSVIPLVGKTWAPIGKTPVLRHNGRWDKVSAIAAVTPTGKLYFQMRLGSYDSAGVIEFLKDLLRHIRRRILLIWDNGLIHRSREMKAFLHKQRHRLEVYRLPPYAPELNPVEPFNSQLKFHKLRNYCPDTTEQLLRTVHRSVGTRQSGTCRAVLGESTRATKAWRGRDLLRACQGARPILT